MTGANGTLVTAKPHSEIINDLIRGMKREYNAFLKADESLSKGDIPSFLSNFKAEYKFLEEAGKEIRILQQKTIGRLNELQQRLIKSKEQARESKHKNSKSFVGYIDKFLDATYEIERAMRTGTRVAISQESTLGQLTHK